MAEKVETERLDVLLVQRGLAPGRDQAKAYIMAGNVYVDAVSYTHLTLPTNSRV